MEIQRISVLAITLSFIVWVVLILQKIECRDLESPKYTVVHSESDFEIRFYRETVWMSAPSDEISFEKATKDGFHSIVPGAGPLHSSAYFVGHYLPVKFQAGPPVPLPELHLKPDQWKSHCIAVRKFSGFARDNNIVKEAEKLAVSLSNGYAYSIAQYNFPFKFIGRVNEVWVDVNGSEKDGCKSNLLAAY
ncbi:heme-binding protein [Striga asiatica]|uniref:Heme-binding protein n=1 Tax=Striga asiatica TaxID=4170 RepID=A0A5A7P481_STRAF|nr:heme-binding protein [Striga asiatica]